MFIFLFFWYFAFNHTIYSAKIWFIVIDKERQLNRKEHQKYPESLFDPCKP